MVLHSQNSGKYLSAEWARERERCAQDDSQYTEAEKEFYEVTRQSPGMGNRDEMESSTFKMDSQPIDPLSTSKEVDFRDVRREIGR